MISLDISKAFDRFWHKDLLTKLPMFGLHHTLIKLIGSFLPDWSIAVRVDGSLSTLHSINAGVPQGSVISPVLFILFINDLPTSTSSSIHSFADDTFLSSSFSFIPNDHGCTDNPLHRKISASLFSNDLTFIEKWGKANLFQILSRALFSGDQGDYSYSSEACQNHQKLNSFIPIPSFTAYFTKLYLTIIIHPKNMQFMERLAFSFSSRILQLAISQI